MDIAPVYHFEIQKDGQYSVFKYKKSPVSYKLAAPLCFLTFIPAIYFSGLSLSSDSSFTSYLIVWLIYMIVFALALTFLINKLRKGGEFRISKDAIVLNGKNYDRGHVSQIFIRTPKGEERYASQTVIVHNPASLGGAVASVTTGISQVAAASGEAIRKTMRESSYKICIRFAAKDIPVAVGLNEVHAEVLLDKIVEECKF